MSKEKSPAFQFYPSDYLSDIRTTQMTLEEEGMYLRLLMHCWIEGSIPDDARTVQLLCKGSAATPLVLSCFTSQDGVLIHKRLDAEREKQAAWRAKCAEGGRATAHKRKKLTKQQGSTAIAPPDPRKGSTALQSSSSVFSLQSSSSFSRKEKPVPSEQVKRKPKSLPPDFPITEKMRSWAKEKIPETEIDRETERFIDHYRGNGKRWLDWEAAWRNWMRNANDWSRKSHKPSTTIEDLRKDAEATAARIWGKKNE